MITNTLSLSEYINQLGFKYVFAGDPFTVSGMEMLGAIEGAVSVSPSYTLNNYTLPELTGEAVHEAIVMGAGLTVQIPLIMGNSELWSKISPTGTASGGYSTPQSVVETSLIIVPAVNFPGAGVSYSGTTWTPTGVDATNTIQNQITIWRGYFMPGEMSLSVENGGKVISTVTFTAMHYDANPEGHKLWTRGNPVTAGVTTFRL